MPQIAITNNMSELSASGKQTPEEIEIDRIKQVQQNAVVRVEMERDDLVRTVRFRTEPSAAKLTNQQFIKDCLKHPADFAIGGPKRSQSRTWLHQMVFLQDLEGVGALIRAGQDVNAVDDLGRTALHYACAIGSKPIVESLLKKGSFKDVELMDKMGYKPLHLAAEGGYHGVIKTLVKDGEADVNATGPDGFRALHLICQGGKGVACFTALLTVGEKLDLKEEDMYGRTPLDILRDVMGKTSGKKSNAAQAIRKDKRTPWKLLNAAFSQEIKRRKDAVYLRVQDIEEKEKQKQIALDRMKAGAKAQVAKAMKLAREAFDRGEVVDWAALGLDPEMEDELRAIMAEEEDDDDDDEEEEGDYGYSEEEQSGDDDNDGDDDKDDDGDGDDDENGEAGPTFPQDYIDEGGGEMSEGRKMQMAAMAEGFGDEDEEQDEENPGDDEADEEEDKREHKESGQKEGTFTQKGGERIEQEGDNSEEDETKPGLLEETYEEHIDEDDHEDEVVHVVEGKEVPKDKKINTIETKTALIVKEKQQSHITTTVEDENTSSSKKEESKTASDGNLHNNGNEGKNDDGDFAAELDY